MKRRRTRRKKKNVTAATHHHIASRHIASHRISTSLASNWLGCIFCILGTGFWALMISHGGCIFVHAARPLIIIWTAFWIMGLDMVERHISNRGAPICLVFWECIILGVTALHFIAHRNSKTTLDIYHRTSHCLRDFQRLLSQVPPCHPQKKQHQSHDSDTKDPALGHGAGAHVWYASFRLGSALGDPTTIFLPPRPSRPNRFQRLGRPLV